MLIQDVNEAKMLGKVLGRAGLSEAVIAAVKEWDGESYKGAIELAGKLKVIAAAARCDEYWSEKVGRGEASGMNLLRRLASAVKAEAS